MQPVSVSGGKAITVESRDGAGSTIVDCEGSGVAFIFDSGETSESRLLGFTIENGSFGVQCSNGSPSVVQCIITRNSHTGIVWSDSPGGEIKQCTISYNGLGIETGGSAPVISDSLVCENYQGGVRGGLCAPIIRNCVISDNRGDVGAGLWFTVNGAGVPQLLNSVVEGNEAQFRGGGIACVNGGYVLLDGCVIRGNSAQKGGGIYFGKSDELGSGPGSGRVVNCVVVGNEAAHGANLFLENGARVDLVNCTILNGSDGGTIYDNEGQWTGTLTAVNSILWNGPSIACMVGGGWPQLKYCDVQGDWVGAGNFSADPVFMKPASHNYRLDPKSPCIDAGTQKSDVVTLPETDIIGVHRVMYGGKSLKVDIGAYEFHIWPPVVEPLTRDLTLTWSTLAGKTYSVFRSADMLLWEPVGEDIPSAGDTVTTWIDPTTPLLSPQVPRAYYRVQEKQ
jgi:hypothetical protein